MRHPRADDAGGPGGMRDPTGAHARGGDWAGNLWFARRSASTPLLRTAQTQTSHRRLGSDDIAMRSFSVAANTPPPTLVPTGCLVRLRLRAEQTRSQTNGSSFVASCFFEGCQLNRTSTLRTCLWSWRLAVHANLFVIVTSVKIRLVGRSSKTREHGLPLSMPIEGTGSFQRTGVSKCSTFAFENI